MPECPDCGGELVVSADSTESQGVHKVYECNDCGKMFELTEVSK